MHTVRITTRADLANSHGPLSPEVKWGLVAAPCFGVHVTFYCIFRIFLYPRLRNWMMLSWHLLASLGISQKRQICFAVTRNHSFDNILKTKNGRAMKSVSIHMFSWSINTMNIKTTSNQHMQIGIDITKYPTFAIIISKTKNDRTMKYSTDLAKWDKLF